MRRFISILVVALLAVPTMALAGRGFKHGFGHGFNRLNPVMVKKVLKEAGASDQQIRRVQGLIDETKTKTLDVKHELEKARLDIEQLMRAENPDRAAIFKQIDKIGALKLQLKKLWVGTILDVRRELTPEQWEKVQMFKAERRMKHRKKMRQRFRQTQPVQP
jgi:Spy/CpxP family protein refolding chaperone